MVVELAAVEGVQFSTAQQFGAVTVFTGTALAKGLQQVFFSLGAGKQVRAVAFEVKARLLRPLAPDTPAGPGQIEHHPRWLAGDQRLAEVAHRRAQGRVRAFEDMDLKPAFGGRVGMGQTQNASADDKH